MLIAARAAQGVGAALLSPSALSIVATTFHGPDRNKALGVWAAIGGARAALGVVLGGGGTAGPPWVVGWLIHSAGRAVVASALPPPLRRPPALESGRGRRA